MPLKGVGMKKKKKPKEKKLLERENERDTIFYGSHFRVCECKLAADGGVTKITGVLDDPEME